MATSAPSTPVDNAERDPRARHREDRDQRGAADLATPPRKAVLNDPSTYEALKPEDFGLTRYVSIAHRLTGWNAVKRNLRKLVKRAFPEKWN